MTEEQNVEVYRIHIWLRQISPMIWRRLLVRDDSTIADLHHTFQIAFGWSDTHLNQFHIHGQDYGVSHNGGIGFSTDPERVQLRDFGFRINERFLYEYDFGNRWQHEVRIEASLKLEDSSIYPNCIGGRRQAPPEDCGGPLSFMAQRDHLPQKIATLFGDIEDGINANDLETIRDRVEDIEDLRDWLALDAFDRNAVNRRLKQYATGDDAWRWG
jgi:hypothetical protein